MAAIVANAFDGPARAMAAGMFNTIRLAAESLASVVVVALVASFVHTRLADASLPAGLDAARAADELAAGDVGQLFAQYPDHAHTLASAHASAFHQVMWVSVVLAAVSVVAVLVLLRRDGKR
ncbi:hypothetical protein PUR59_03180 [Streptomyces sp. SP18ES09]|uniref:hypothetical protein n=1 Tax=Streptomyces sp. SP18ES09 TaxID=3002532 RepID=UPI002E79B857|nr:hypothetical protein [Streptomyces sp. SP18ES09]MEE1814022.1 hypothetical protein [Streptomyces sp. SP18ES09]